MAKLKIVYTEQDSTVFLYRDCDIEAECRSWLEKLVECKDTGFIFVFHTAQELVLSTMQSLLCSEYRHLLPYVLFYVEDFECTLDSDGHLDPYPSMYPCYQLKCLERIWDL